MGWGPLRLGSMQGSTPHLRKLATSDTSASDQQLEEHQQRHPDKSSGNHITLTLNPKP